MVIVIGARAYIGSGLIVWIHGVAVRPFVTGVPVGRRNIVAFTAGRPSAACVRHFVRDGYLVNCRFKISSRDHARGLGARWRKQRCDRHSADHGRTDKYDGCLHGVIYPKMNARRQCSRPASFQRQGVRIASRYSIDTSAIIDLIKFGLTLAVERPSPLQSL
jgi:hypothetical protein